MSGLFTASRSMPMPSATTSCMASEPSVSTPSVSVLLRTYLLSSVLYRPVALSYTIQALTSVLGSMVS